MHLLPWEYLFQPFNASTSRPVLAAHGRVAVLLVGHVVLYNVRTRRFHGHRPYLDMYEWLCGRA